MRSELVPTRAAGSDEQRVLVLAPPPAQAELVRRVEAAGLASRVCGDLRELSLELEAGAGALLLTEEALSGDIQGLIQALWSQPQWSDVPTILLAGTDLLAGGDPDVTASAWAMERLGNVTVLEPSVRASTLQSALRAAIRSRRRQYQLRDKVTELHRSEERFRLIAEAVSESIWDLDVATGRIRSTESVRSIFGYGSNEIVAHVDTWKVRQHPDDRARVAAAFQRALAGDGTTWVEEYRFQKADGSYAHVLDRAHIIRDASGAPVRIVGATLDMSERKQAEEASARHAAIVESSDDAIVSKTLDGTILSWNGGAERLFGYSAERGDRQADHARHPARTAAARRRRSWRASRAASASSTSRRSDARSRADELFVSLTVSPVRDATGRIIGASKVARDVTARRVRRRDAAPAGRGAAAAVGVGVRRC